MTWPFPRGCRWPGKAVAFTTAPEHSVRRTGARLVREQPISALCPHGLVLAEPCISQNRYRSLYIDFIWFY